MERSGTIHGFAGWFEADLAPGVVLSTAPDKPTTHWHQSYFPIRPFRVEAGDRVELGVRAVPSQHDPRLPLYFLDGALFRDGEEICEFDFCVGGSFD